MIDEIQSVIGGQYGASLGMLGACLERADDATWHAVVGKFPFWHVAYHTGQLSACLRRTAQDGVRWITSQSL